MSSCSLARLPECNETGKRFEQFVAKNGPTRKRDPRGVDGLFGSVGANDTGAGSPRVEMRQATAGYERPTRARARGL